MRKLSISPAGIAVALAIMLLASGVAFLLGTLEIQRAQEAKLTATDSRASTALTTGNTLARKTQRIAINQTTIAANQRAAVARNLRNCVAQREVWATLASEQRDLADNDAALARAVRGLPDGSVIAPLIVGHAEPERRLAEAALALSQNTCAAAYTPVQ